MLTDRPLRNAALLAGFLESDRLRTLEVPHDVRLLALRNSIDSALGAGTTAAVRQVCAEFLSLASDFYRVSKPGVRVLAARPVRVREGGWAIELFGDYAPETTLIRVWMRTAVRKQVTSLGTFLSSIAVSRAGGRVGAPYGDVLPPSQLIVSRDMSGARHRCFLRFRLKAILTWHRFPNLTADHENFP